MQQTDSAFEEDVKPVWQEPDADEADILLINIDGYEGPLDVLLELARRQKVDLARISILALVRQYLGFIERAKALKLELAADYLVMAAWLAYLKSRLLLPKQSEEVEEELSAERMALALQFQLRRLEAMQESAAALWARPRLGQQMFVAGQQAGVTTKVEIVHSASYYDLISAYGDIRQRAENAKFELPSYELMSTEAALERITKMLGKLPEADTKEAWVSLENFFPEPAETSKYQPIYTRSTRASMLTATLELAKQGALELKQDGTFGAIYLRTLAQGDNQEASQVNGEQVA